MLKESNNGGDQLRRILDQRKRQADARLELLQMDTLEPLARNSEQMPESKLSDAEISGLQQLWADRYREVVGVPVAERQQLRGLLVELVETGESAVAREIERLRGHTLNGSSSLLSSDADSSAD